MWSEVTPESSDENVSSSVNATTTETGTESPAGHVLPQNPVIVRATILLIFTIFNLGGNGFTLITIRLTPRLWTKTNYILASMLVVSIITGVLIFWYIPFILFVSTNPCHFNVITAAVTPMMKLTVLVFCYHVIVVCVERYIAIVYPLHYETMFSDRTLKCAILAAWATGIFVSMTFALWLINADLEKCGLIPDRYQLVDVFFAYLPVCITMFICYGRILVISWRQRRRIEPINVIPAHGAPVSATSVSTAAPTHSGNAHNTKDPKNIPLTGNVPPVAMTSGAATAELAEQQRQKIKSRRREFKAVYLTAAIVGAFVILWVPHILGRVLASVGYNPVVINYIGQAAGAIGAFNFSFTWALYAAVSKSYRRAYRQVLIRIGFGCFKNITPQADNSLIV